VLRRAAFRNKKTDNKAGSEDEEWVGLLYVGQETDNDAEGQPQIRECEPREYKIEQVVERLEMEKEHAANISVNKCSWYCCT
jgi:hypothetical protein